MNRYCFDIIYFQRFPCQGEVLHPERSAVVFVLGFRGPISDGAFAIEYSNIEYIVLF